MTRILRYFIRYEGPDEWVYNYARRKLFKAMSLTLFVATIGLLLIYLWFGNETVGKAFVTTYMAFLGSLFLLFRKS